MRLGQFFLISFGIASVVLSVGCQKDGRTASKASVLAAPAIAPSPRPDGDASATGTLAGSVRHIGNPPKPVPLMIVKDAGVCGREKQFDDSLLIGKSGGLRNAVVSITNIRGGKALSSFGGNLILDQRQCIYEPHILLAPVNTPIRILNHDGVLHNIHTYPTANPAQNIAQPPALKEMEIRFALPERIQVRCDLHGWMSGWIVAVDHPYHALTDADGDFSLTDVPPGKYTVTCWHEVLGEQSKEVEVLSGGVTPLEFEFR